MNPESNLPLMLRKARSGPGTAGSRPRPGHQPDGAVGQNTVDVEENDLDAASAILCGQCHDSILNATAMEQIRENRGMDGKQPADDIQPTPALEPEDYYFRSEE